MSTAQTFTFQAEVQQLLHLMIHSLYSSKEIFLRELIANASDAADKLRFAALAEPSLLTEDPTLKIRVEVDKAERTISVIDNGIGMNKEEVIEHLGTIAKSGTQAFLTTLAKKDQADMSFIGQFGVGFYSVFMVADHVTLKTRRAGLPENKGVLWTSNGQGEYQVSDLDKVTRGTEITLHLKSSEEDFLSPWTLRRIIQTYSDHIALPIEMGKMTPNDEQEATASSDIKEVVNQASALWMRSKTAISNEQYQAFYQHLSHDTVPPLAWSHAHLEGKQHYTLLLYIPTQAPFDLYHPTYQRQLKLYVRRVFIMEAAKQLLPNYLRFMQGVVDSDDLPLNVSRELLQTSPDVEAIKGGCTKKVLDLLESLAKDRPEDYKTFYQAFGQVLKEGVVEDLANRAKITQLLRFYSTHATGDCATVSLSDYVARMKPNQEKIYVITAENYAAAIHSPHLEVFRQQDIEVLLLIDRVDEWVLASLPDFEGKLLQSVTKGALNLDNIAPRTTKQTAVAKEAMAPVVEKIKSVLGDKVSSVRTTERLVDSPACLVVGEHDMSQHLTRLLKAAGQNEVASALPILEINPAHPLIQRLLNEVATPQAEDLSVVLYHQALLTSGSTLETPTAFLASINRLIAALPKPNAKRSAPSASGTSSRTQRKSKK